MTVKLHLLLASVAILTASVAHAQLTVVSVNFLEEPPTLPAILSADGTAIPVGGGHVAVGTFSITDQDIQSLLYDGNVAGVLGAWVQHGGSGVFNGLGDSVAGFFEVTTEANSPVSGVGDKTIYTLITNTTTPGDHSELLIFRHNEVFPVVEIPAVDVLTVRVIPTSGSLIWGGYGNYLFDALDLGPAAAYNTQGAIPESSTATALLALGALVGFVAYRRRR